MMPMRKSFIKRQWYTIVYSNKNNDVLNQAIVGGWCTTQNDGKEKNTTIARLQSAMMANRREEEWRVTKERTKRVCVMGYVCHMINTAHEIQSKAISLTPHCSTHISVIFCWTSLFVFLLQPSIRCSRSTKLCPFSADVDVPFSRSITADIACASKQMTMHEKKQNHHVYTYFVLFYFLCLSPTDCYIIDINLYIYIHFHAHTQVKSD